MRPKRQRKKKSVVQLEYRINMSECLVRYKLNQEQKRAHFNGLIEMKSRIFIELQWILQLKKKNCISQNFDAMNLEENWEKFGMIKRWNWEGDNKTKE